MRLPDAPEAETACSLDYVERVGHSCQRYQGNGLRGVHPQFMIMRTMAVPSELFGRYSYCWYRPIRGICDCNAPTNVRSIPQNFQEKLTF
jgi:hypothetical protein